MIDGFILYSHYEDNFKTLKDKDRGKLIMALFAFNDGRDLSSTLSKSALSVYNYITEEITKSKTKHKEMCEKNKQNVLKRWQKQKNTTVYDRNTTVSNENTTVSNKVYDRINEGYDRINPPQNTDTTVLNGVYDRINGAKSVDTTVLNDGLNKSTNIINKQTSLVSLKNKNIFNNYTACEHAHVSEKTFEERKPFKELYNEVFEYGLTDKFLKPAHEIIDTMIEAYNQAQTSNKLKFKQTTYDPNKLIDVFTMVDADKFRKIVNQLVFNESIDNRAIYILGCLITASQNPKCNNTAEKINKFRNQLAQVKVEI